MQLNIDILLFYMKIQDTIHGAAKAVSLMDHGNIWGADRARIVYFMKILELSR